jgi:hypothetical protein
MSRSFPTQIIRLNMATDSEPRFVKKGVRVPSVLTHFDAYFYNGTFYFVENGHDAEFKHLVQRNGEWVAYPMVYSVTPKQNSDGSFSGFMTYGSARLWARQQVGEMVVSSFSSAELMVAGHNLYYKPAK